MNKKAIAAKKIKRGDLLTMTKKGKVIKAEISKIKKIPIIYRMFREVLNSPGRIVGIAKEDIKKGELGTVIVSGINNTQIEEYKE